MSRGTRRIRPEARAGLSPRRRRPVEHHRLGRRPKLQLLRQHHDQKRQLLQMHELRQHQRLLVVRLSQVPRINLTICLVYRYIYL